MMAHLVACVQCTRQMRAIKHGDDDQPSGVELVLGLTVTVLFTGEIYMVSYRRVYLEEVPHQQTVII